MRKAYPTHILCFVCDSCGTRFNVAVEWDYMLDEQSYQPSPVCALCELEMRDDRELFQAALSLELEEEVEAATARRVEMVWRARAKKVREKAQAVEAEYAEPLPDFTLSIANRLRFLRAIVRGDWDERRKRRDDLRPEDAGKVRPAPLFRLVSSGCGQKLWLRKDGNNLSYFNPEDTDLYAPSVIEMLADKTTGISRLPDTPKWNPWAITPAGPQLLRKSDMMPELLKWYRGFGPNWRQGLRPKLDSTFRGRLDDHVLDTLLEHGGKAVAPELWHNICVAVTPECAAALEPRSGSSKITKLG